MILYFTGTGNSYYTAKRIASELGEPLKNIVDLVQSKEFTVRLGKEEKLGFVFPVYYYGGTYYHSRFRK